MIKQQCSGKQGTCRSRPTASGYCFMHDPKRSKERAEARRRGGRATKAKHGADGSTVPNKVRSVNDVLTLLDYSLKEAITLDNSIVRGRLLVAISSSYLDVIRTGELEKRLEALEQMQQPGKSERRRTYVN